MKKALRQMGYRNVDNYIWCKVVGFNLFVFNSEKNTWTNWFKGANGKNLIWNSTTFGTGDFLLFLKLSESQSKLVGVELPSEFEFLTVEEGAELEL